MKIGLLSDTHIHDADSEEARSLIRLLKKVFSGVDIIFHAGDILTLDFLQELEKIAPVDAVHGNMDHIITRSSLPEKKLIEVENLTIGLIHGSGPPAGIRQRLLPSFYPRPDIIIYGHTHHPDDTHENGVWFINPGSPTDRHFTDINSLAILHFENEKPRVEIIKIRGR